MKYIMRYIFMRYNRMEHLLTLDFQTRQHLRKLNMKKSSCQRLSYSVVFTPSFVCLMEPLHQLGVSFLSSHFPHLFYDLKTHFSHISNTDHRGWGKQYSTASSWFAFASRGQDRGTEWDFKWPSSLSPGNG